MTVHPSLADGAVHSHPLRAALYGRVSHDKRGRSKSVDQQDTAGEKVAAANGWEIGDRRYADSNVSASRFSKKVRRDWQRLLADIDAGKIDVLIVWEFSRGDRKLGTSADLLDLCRERGVLIHVTSEERTYDPRIPADRKALGAGALDAEYESEKTSARVRRDKRATAVAGKPDGRVVYGYERIYHPVTRELVEQRPHPERAPIVREIVTRIAKGDPISAVTADLTARGIPTPSGDPAWHRSTVRRIALHPAYIGERHYDGQVLAGNWPALVDDATHFRAVRLLGDPARKTTRPGAAKWLLSYIVTCGECGAEAMACCEGRCDHPARPGAPMGTFKRGRSATIMYVCSSPRQCAAVKVEWLDEVTVKLLLARLSDPKVHRHLRATDDAAILAARAEVARLQTQLEEYYDAADTLSPAAMARAEARLLPLLAEARAREKALSAAAGPVHELIGDGEEPDDVAEIAARFEAMTVAQRKTVVRAMLKVSVRKQPAAGRPTEIDPSRVHFQWLGGRP